jgi:putative acetyltransferase
VRIRPEQPEDFEAIDKLVRAAFGQQEEVDLVHKIRTLDTYVPELALIATDDGQLVGHIMLSYAMLARKRVLQLAPLAVLPKRQGEGIGGSLTRVALDLADKKNEPLVLVLGHPEYYPKFGFESARAKGIQPAAKDIPDEAWMVRTLSAYDPALKGTASFPATDG